MKRSEVAALLTFAAALERNGWVPTETDVEAWHAMAEEGGWESFEIAKRALLVHRSEQPNYPLRPGHITQVLERVRESARRSFEPGRVPDDAAEDLVAYKRWITAEAGAHRAQVLAEFVAGRRPALRAIEAAS